MLRITFYKSGSVVMSIDGEAQDVLGMAKAALDDLHRDENGASWVEVSQWVPAEGVNSWQVMYTIRKEFV